MAVCTLRDSSSGTLCEVVETLELDGLGITFMLLKITFITIILCKRCGLRNGDVTSAGSRSYTMGGVDR